MKLLTIYPVYIALKIIHFLLFVFFKSKVEGFVVMGVLILLFKGTLFGGILLVFCLPLQIIFSFLIKTDNDKVKFVHSNTLDEKWPILDLHDESADFNYSMGLPPYD